MPDKRILVVDDNELVRRLVGTYLKERGHEVLICEGPFGVLNAVRAHKPDVILMDLNMPGLSGQKLAELVNSGRSGNRCRLLIFSSADERIQAELVNKGYADGYFIKSHSLEGLGRKIDELTETRDECYA